MMQKQRLIDIVKFLIFTCLGLGVFWYVYREQDFTNIWDTFEHLKWEWVCLSLFISLLSHVSRAMRWQILIKTLGVTPRLHNTIFAVFIMYLANMALPRMGEVTRCGIIKRYENISFTQLLGTVFLERLIDMLMLLALTGFVVYTQMDVLLNFFKANPDVQAKAAQVFTAQNLLFVTLSGLACLGGLIAFLRYNKSEAKLVVKLRNTIAKFSEGLQTIYRMKQKFWFVAHSLIIWGIYFYMLYLAFFAFSFTGHLNLSAGVVIFVLSSFGMVAPVSGGMGAWHFMVIQALLLYNIDKSDAAAFALLVHSAMTLTLMVAGALSVALLPVFNKKNISQKPKPEGA